MGVSFYVHAGPVLICKYHMEEKVERQTIITRINSCANPDCKPYTILAKNAKFCPRCGTSTQMLESEKEMEKRTKEKSVPHIFDLLSEGGFREDRFDECWGGLNREKLIENCDLLSPTSDFLGREMLFEARQFAIHVRKPDMQAEIAKCEEFYAKEIAYLRTKYDEVSIEWMVLTTGS
jgi:hypothetical protein